MGWGPVILLLDHNLFTVLHILSVLLKVQVMELKTTEKVSCRETRIRHGDCLIAVLFQGFNYPYGA